MPKTTSFHDRCRSGPCRPHCSRPLRGHLRCLLERVPMQRQAGLLATAAPPTVKALVMSRIACSFAGVADGVDQDELVARVRWGMARVRVDRKRVGFGTGYMATVPFVVRDDQGRVRGRRSRLRVRLRRSGRPRRAPRPDRLVRALLPVVHDMVCAGRRTRAPPSPGVLTVVITVAPDPPRELDRRVTDGPRASGHEHRASLERIGAERGRPVDAHREAPMGGHRRIGDARANVERRTLRQCGRPGSTGIVK